MKTCCKNDQINVVCKSKSFTITCPKFLFLHCLSCVYVYIYTHIHKFLLEPHGWGKSFEFMKCTLIVK